MNVRTCGRAQNNKLGGHPWQSRCYVRGALSKATVVLSRDKLQVLEYLKSHCLIDTGATQAAHAHTSCILASELKNCPNEDVDNTLKTLDMRGTWDWREAERMESGRKSFLHSSPVTVQGCPLAGLTRSHLVRDPGHVGFQGPRFSYRTDARKERMELGENTLTCF